MSLIITPLLLKEANRLVESWHRHHGPVVGAVFAIGVSHSNAWKLDECKVVVGAAIVGRPVARGLQDGWTLEVTRCVTDGTKNACSALYGGAWRTARALGYRRLITYTLASESGTSLRASGWRVVGEVQGRSWHCESRPRVDTAPLQDKLRWEVAA